MASIWQTGVNMPQFPALDGSRKVDVLIIGGGLTGLLCAHHLAQAGVDYLLAEQGRVCQGVTGNTTAKLTAQHGLIYHKLLSRFGLERAGLYLQANLRALERYRALCSEIDCDFSEQDSFIYSLDDPGLLEQELNALEKLGYAGELVHALPLPFPTAGAVKFTRQGQFHPLKFSAAIANGLKILESTRVTELAPGRAVTERGVISAEKVIVTTHFPMLNKHGSYFLKLYQNRSYVLALENGPELQGMYLDEAPGGLSFRSAEGHLLLGGGSHRTGIGGRGWAPLESFARQHYPQAAITHRWAAQDCMPLDQAPYIGPYSRSCRNLYVATGFQKWGMTTAMAAAEILTDLVRGRENPYAPAFSPSRSMLRPQLAVNAAHAIGGLLRPTAPRCPHMGCALRYNPQEHSWDCGCHGSRFDTNGRCLDNPANNDLKKRP